MRSHRLNRLALLTQGVALIGLGATDLACGKEKTNEQIHINSPPQPVPTMDAQPPTINSPPMNKPDAGK